MHFLKIMGLVAVMLGGSFSVPIIGQDASAPTQQAKEFGLQIHFGVLQAKEENLIPIAHRGTITTLEVEYEWRGSKIGETHFNLSYGRPKTGFENLQATLYLNLDLAWSNGFPLINKPHFGYWAGPGLGLQYTAVYYPHWDDSHFYWGNSLSWNLQQTAVWRLRNNQEFWATCSLPVVAFFNQSPAIRLEKAEDTSPEGLLQTLHRHPELGTWNRVFPFELNLEYRFPLLSNMMEAITYRFSYMRLKGKESNSFQQLVHEIGLKIQW